MFTWLVPVALTALLVRAACKLAPTIGLVDTPTGRKSHQGEIPLVGGIAIFLGLVITLTFFGLLQSHWAFLLAALLLVLVGIWDDMRNLFERLFCGDSGHE